jgi:predicted transcriptional regulator
MFRFVYASIRESISSLDLITVYQERYYILRDETLFYNETFINVIGNLNKMNNTNLEALMTELLNKDRLNYLEIIVNSENGEKSLDITKKILKSRGITQKEKIRKENIKVNKRLRKLIELEVLVSGKKGEYKISSLGHLLLDSWRELTEKAETMEKFHEFFESHYVEEIPREFRRQIYRLKGAELVNNPIRWVREVSDHMHEIERKFYNLTELLHDIPSDIIEKKEKEEIEEISIIYQFKEYPILNYSDEKKESFDRLVRAGAEFRYITLENRHPIGIRIIDEKWATFGLEAISDKKTSEKRLDRTQTLVGTNPEFIKWCRELMYQIWHFKAKPLEIEGIIEKGENQ